DTALPCPYTSQTWNTLYIKFGSIGIMSALASSPRAAWIVRYGCSHAISSKYIIPIQSEMILFIICGQQSTVNGQRSTDNSQLSTVNCQLTTD
ncbi:hypothetical protein QT972_01260, partial [Microcoleus sp. herbarium7]|uniref:hypothetical protein n=1 Tax=Microcoleus sp. herbarium7 TaxID=3055435 RepID=UPI002FD25D4D